MKIHFTVDLYQLNHLENRCGEIAGLGWIAIRRNFDLIKITFSVSVCSLSFSASSLYSFSKWKCLPLTSSSKLNSFYQHIVSESCRLLLRLHFTLEREEFWLWNMRLWPRKSRRRRREHRPWWCEWEKFRRGEKGNLTFSHFLASFAPWMCKSHWSSAQEWIIYEEKVSLGAWSSFLSSNLTSTRNFQL